MKKRSFLLLSMFVILSKAISAANYDIEVDGIYYKYVDDVPQKALTIVSGDKKYEGDIIIPSVVKVNNVEYTVLRIDKAFEHCTSLTSVVIPNTVDIIFSYSFYGCI